MTIIYYASATASASATNAYGVVYTATASATASSIISEQDAYTIAYNEALLLAQESANASAEASTSSGTRNHDNTQTFNSNCGLNFNDEFLDVGNDLLVRGNFNIELNLENNSDCNINSIIPTINSDIINRNNNSNTSGGTRNHDQLQIFGKNGGFNINDEFIDIGNDLIVNGDFNLRINIKC